MVFHELSVGLSFKVASVRVRLIEVGCTHPAPSEAFNSDPLKSVLGYSAIGKSLPRGSRLNSPNISLLSARGIALLEAECLSRLCLKLQCV